MSENEATWTRHAIAGHPVDLFRPPTPHCRGYTVLFLHGLQQPTLQGKRVFEDLLAQHGLSVVAPHCGPTWWVDRVTAAFDAGISPQHYLLESVLPFMARHMDVQPPRIALLGISMGGQGALRLAYKFPDIFPVVAAISPAIDYQRRLAEDDEILWQLYGDPEAARQDTATLHIHPLNWPRHQFFCCDPVDYRWYDSADRLRMKLGSLGVPYEAELEISAGGHGWDYFNRMADRAFRFIVERLDQERRRVE